jgi:hypothetical protein
MKYLGTISDSKDIVNKGYVDDKFLPATVSSPTSGQVISYNGSAWVNANPAAISQQQANWTETNTSSVQYIMNKPTALSSFTNDVGYIYLSSTGTKSGWAYYKYSDGSCRAWTVSKVTTGTLTMTQKGSGSIYLSDEKSLSIPSGLFTNGNYFPVFQIFSSSYVVNIGCSGSTDNTATTIYYNVKKGGPSTLSVAFKCMVFGY